MAKISTPKTHSGYTIKQVLPFYAGTLFKGMTCEEYAIRDSEGALVLLSDGQRVERGDERWRPLLTHEELTLSNASPEGREVVS